jgi:hypothetical protein
MSDPTPPVDPRLTPKRIQRKRIKGWRMPKGAVYVGRPTHFGNDWTMKDAAIRGHLDPRVQRQWAIDAYRHDVMRNLNTPGTRWHRDELKKLRGKDLACWCPLDQPCHADVLLEIANAE